MNIKVKEYYEKKLKLLINCIIIKKINQKCYIVIGLVINIDS